MSKRNECRYDWEEVQSYYDEGNSWREVCEKFGMCLATISNARRRGAFHTSRDKSESGVLAKRKGRGLFKHTEETKKKISDHRRSYLEENPDKVPYLLNHYSKGPSYPEQYFQTLFENEGIVLDRYYRIGIYELDFAHLPGKIDIEIDGEQHYADPRIVESDIRRDEFMKSNGWKVMRIRWSEYQKLSRNEKEQVINNIKGLW